MTDAKSEINALIKAVADMPKRDNTDYHRAINEARQAFEDAETVLGCPVRVKMKTRIRRNGEYVLKWVFRPAED